VGDGCCHAHRSESRELAREAARRRFSHLPREERAVEVAKSLRTLDDWLGLDEPSSSTGAPVPSSTTKANVYGADRPSPIATPGGGGRGAPMNAAAEPLKYQEIRNALRDGEFSAATIEAWRESYVEMVETRLAPVWRASALSAHGELSRGLVRVLGESVRFEATAARLDEWIAIRGTELAVSLTDSTHRALRGVLRQGIAENPIGARDLGRYLRPLVGLTPGQATAVERFRANLLGEGLDPSKVTHRVENYAGYLSRIRAERIARTEIAFAFNRSGLDTMRSARDEGLVRSSIVKTYLTGRDERVCPFCAPLDGEIVELEQTFPGATRLLPFVLSPPVHPNCRCSLLYGML